MNPALHCTCCGHEWRPIRDTLPKVCPRCKRYEWQEPRAPLISRPLVEKRGRPRKIAALDKWAGVREKGGAK